MRTALAILCGAIIIATPFAALAQDAPGTVGDCPPGTTLCLPDPLGVGSGPREILDNVLNFLLEAGGIVATIMIVVGAFQILFAKGDPEKFLVGKRTIIYTVIAYGILVLVKITSLFLLVQDIID